MTIGDLIKELERHPPDKVIPFGFANPHSYRGVYSDVAFEPARDVTIGSILAAAREAMGRTFTGWKGGEYTMDEWTDVHLAEMGRCGEEIGPTLLAFMLTGAPPTEYGLSMYEEGRYRGRDEGSARKRASLLQAVESVVRERDEWQRAAESQNQQWSAKCEEVTEATARAEAAEAGWKRCAADLASETARANRAEERAEAAIAERDEAMKRASVAKGASEYEARRAESAEAALAEMREALRQTAECGCHVPFRRCPDRAPPPPTNCTPKR